MNETSHASDASLDRLSREIFHRISDDDFELLCQDLGVSGTIDSGSLENKLRQLFDHLIRTGHMSNLVDKLKVRLPEVEWSSFATVSQTSTPPIFAIPSAGNPISHDSYHRYTRGMSNLAKVIPVDHYKRGEFDTQQLRMTENLNRARRYGDPPSRQTERAEIFDSLNAISRVVTGKSFNEWMDE